MRSVLISAGGQARPVGGHGEFFVEAGDKLNRRLAITFAGDNGRPARFAPFQKALALVNPQSISCVSGP